MKHFIAFLLTGLAIISCGRSAPFKDGKFIVERGKTVSINELKISITNKGCGRQYIMENGRDEGERPYCDMQVKYADSVIIWTSGYQPLTIGEARIEMDRMNPWGVTEDSVPPGACRVIITKVPGAHR